MELCSLNIPIYILYSCFISFFVLCPIKYAGFLNRSIWLTDGILIGTTTLGQSRPGSNDNEMALDTLQIFRTGALSSYSGHLFFMGGSCPSAGDTDSWQGKGFNNEMI